MGQLQSRYLWETENRTRKVFEFQRMLMYYVVPGSIHRIRPKRIYIWTRAGSLIIIIFFQVLPDTLGLSEKSFAVSSFNSFRWALFWLRNQDS